MISERRSNDLRRKSLSLEKSPISNSDILISLQDKNNMKYVVTMNV